jgi:transposase-like protein
MGVSMGRPRQGEVHVRYSEEFRESAVGRMRGGANVRQLGRELKISRSVLYSWRKQAEEGSRGEKEERRQDREIAVLQAQVRELEAAVGRKLLEVDFLESALRRVGAKIPSSSNAGKKTSGPRSADGWNRKAN